MKDINGKPIALGDTLEDKWGIRGKVIQKYKRIHWQCEDTSYWLCDTFIEAWKLKIVEEL